jgi:hypothetical protein
MECLSTYNAGLDQMFGLGLGLGQRLTITKRRICNEFEMWNCGLAECGQVNPL